MNKNSNSKFVIKPQRAQRDTSGATDIQKQIQGRDLTLVNKKYVPFDQSRMLDQRAMRTQNDQLYNDGMSKDNLNLSYASDMQTQHNLQQS